MSHVKSFSEMSPEQKFAWRAGYLAAGLEYEARLKTAEDVVEAARNLVWRRLDNGETHLIGGRNDALLDALRAFAATSPGSGGGEQ